MTVTEESETESDTSSALGDLRVDFTESLDDPLQVVIYLDEFMTSATHAIPWRNIAAKNIRKIWSIGYEQATLNLENRHKMPNRAESKRLCCAVFSVYVFSLV